MEQLFARLLVDWNGKKIPFVHFSSLKCFGFKQAWTFVFSLLKRINKPRDGEQRQLFSADLVVEGGGLSAFHATTSQQS